MWTLIRRELDEMVPTTLKGSVVGYTFLGGVMVLLMWLLGPRIFGYFKDANNINLFVAMFGLFFVNSTLYFNAEEDASTRQLSFLGILPIRKTHIVHAKFLGCLLLCVAALIWMSLLASVNLFMHDVPFFEALAVVLLFLSAAVFLVSEILLWYFLWGNPPSNWISTFSVVIWIILFLVLRFTFQNLGISQRLLCGISLLSSIITYLICWWAAVQKVRTRGFPRQVTSTEWEKAIRHAEELKRRQSERES